MSDSGFLTNPAKDFLRHRAINQEARRCDGSKKLDHAGSKVISVFKGSTASMSRNCNDRTSGNAEEASLEIAFDRPTNIGDRQDPMVLKEASQRAVRRDMKGSRTWSH